MEKETYLGLNSILRIRCTNCACVSQVMTGKMHFENKHSKISDANSKAVLGALHAGVGHTALNKIFACLNIPQLPHSLFKRYEREIGPAIEEVTKESCERAAEVEGELIIQNVNKLCDELPAEIVQDIYPHLHILKSTNTLNSDEIPGTSSEEPYNEEP